MSSITAVPRSTGARLRPRGSVLFLSAQRLGMLLVASAMAVAMPEARAQSCGVGETPVAFAHTGQVQTLVVPAGVQSIRVHLSGAQGGAGRSGAGTIGGSPTSPGGAGGLGGRVSGTLAVTPGTTLAIGVGGQGSQSVNPGGLGLGLDGMGGGATDLRVGGTDVANRVAVAGGGGGGGNAGWSTSSVIAGGNGGAGGGGAGSSGVTVPGGPGPFGGGGGAVGSGGAPGGGCGTFPATAGNASTGKGGDSFNFSGSFTGAGYGGGGGGGATIGAGGGGAGVGTTACQQNWNGGGGGGGGGSSSAAGLGNPTLVGGVHAGDGAALICMAAPGYSIGGTASGHTGPVTLRLDASNPVSTQQLVVPQGATTFTFATALPSGANWAVSVQGTPAGQVCSVTPASGSLSSADVGNLVLSCATVTTVIAPPTLPAGSFNAAYSQTLTASSPNGGSGPYTFAVTDGALPQGLVLSAAGTLQGTPTAPGTASFTVTATSANGFSGMQAYTLEVSRAAQAITGFAASPAAPVYAPGGTFSVSATPGASTSPLVFGSTTPAVCTVSGSTVTMLSAGSCALTADQAGDANYEAAPTATLAVAISAAAQSITNFVANPASPVYAPGGTFSVSATPGASSSPLVFGSTSPAVCTVSGSTVTMLAAGNCALTADQAGDGNYEAAPTATLAVAISAAAQSITDFVANPPSPVYAPGGTFSVSATPGASTSPLVFGSTSPAVCTVSGSTVTMLSAGNCALTADQAGDGNYEAAPTATLAVAISAAPQSITDFVANPSSPVYAPGGTFSVSATPGASSSPLVFASTSPAVCTVSGSTVTMLAAGTCALTADQAGDGNYEAAPTATLAVGISTAAQAITGFAANPSSPVYAPGGTFSVSATPGASSSPLVFGSTSPAVCTVSGSTVTMLAAGNCALTADQAGDGNYDAAPQATLAVTIAAAAQAITGFASDPAAPVFAPGGTFSVSATPGASTSPLVFGSTSPAVCTVSGSTVTMLSAGTCALTADQAGDGNYEAAPQATLAVAIAAATQAIENFASNPSSPVYAPGGTFSVSATPGASTSPLVFGSTSPAVCTVSGSTVTMLSAGDCALTADQAGDANYEAAPQATLVVAIIAASQSITGFASDPAAPVYAEGGTFTVSATPGASTSPLVFGSTSPAVCTVSGSTVTMLAAGTCALTADQAGDGNYEAAPQATLDVAIALGVPVLEWAEDIQKILGEADFDLPEPTSTSPGAFTYSSSDASVAVLDGRTVSIKGAGVAVITAEQAATANYVAATISLQLTVTDRPDPTKDPSVIEGVQAQIEASMRFASAQLANVHNRLRQLRHAQGTPSHNGINMTVAGGAGGGLTLPLAGTDGAQAGGDAPGYGTWLAGGLVMGELDGQGRGGAGGFDLRSDGLTFGVDRQFGSAVLGLAAGAGWSDADFAEERSGQDATQRSLMAYGLWRVGEHWHVDGMFGIGRLEFDLRRWSALASAQATGKRDGDQLFGSTSVGYTRHGLGMDVTGYGRLEFSRTSLDAYRESGLGIYDLDYRVHTIESQVAALGIEGSHQLDLGGRGFRPFWSVEYRDAVRNTSDLRINYVVAPVAEDYRLGLRSQVDDLWALSAGFDIELSRTWQASFLVRREQGGGYAGNGFLLQLSRGGAGSGAMAPAVEGAVHQDAPRTGQP